MQEEKKAAHRQQIDYLTPERAPAESFCVLWWAALYTVLTVGAELTLDAIWADKQAHWPAVLLMALLLLASGAARRFRPERRHIALRLLPWLDLLVSFLVGAFVFREKNLRSKAIDLLLVLLGMVFLFIGSSR